MRYIVIDEDNDASVAFFEDRKDVEKYMTSLHSEGYADLTVYKAEYSKFVEVNYEAKYKVKLL